MENSSRPLPKRRTSGGVIRRCADVAMKCSRRMTRRWGPSATWMVLKQSQIPRWDLEFRISQSKRRPLRACLTVTVKTTSAFWLDGSPARPPIACRSSQSPPTIPLRPGQGKFRSALCSWTCLLLDRNLAAGFFQLLLGLFGIFLRDAFLDFAGCAFDQVLGFLEAQVG